MHLYNYILLFLIDVFNRKVPPLLKSLVGRRKERGHDHGELMNAIAMMQAQLEIVTEEVDAIRTTFEKKSIVVSEFLPINSIRGLYRSFRVNELKYYITLSYT